MHCTNTWRVFLGKCNLKVNFSHRSPSSSLNCFDSFHSLQPEKQNRNPSLQTQIQKHIWDHELQKYLPRFSTRPADHLHPVNVRRNSVFWHQTVYLHLKTCELQAIECYTEMLTHIFIVQRVSFTGPDDICFCCLNFRVYL